MVTTMLKEAEHLFAMRFGMFFQRLSVVGFVSELYGPRIQNAEIERKQ